MAKSSKSVNQLKKFDALKLTNEYNIRINSFEELEKDDYDIEILKVYV